MLGSVETKDLIQFGLIPEFCGRMPVIVPFKSLTKDILTQILADPKNSLLSQYKTLFEMDQVLI